MKKYILLLMLLGTFQTKAQSIASGSLRVLRDQSQVNMVIDFSDCMIDGKKARSVIVQDPDWDKGVSDIIKRFNGGQIATNNYEMDFGEYPEAKYTLLYKISKIDDDQDCFGKMYLTETGSRQILATINSANGKAGMFGSFFNLLGDAFEHLGEKIGKLINKSK